MIYAGWHLLFLALLSFFLGRKHLRAGTSSQNHAQRLFGLFFIGTGVYQLVQAALYLSREIEYAVYLLPAGVIVFLVSQLIWANFVRAFTQQLVPGFLIKFFYFCFIIVMIASVGAWVIEPLEENVYYHNTWFPGCKMAIFYDFAPLLYFHLDLVFTLFMRFILFGFEFWYSLKQPGRLISRLFSRLLVWESFMWLVLLVEFAVSAGMFEFVYLFETAVYIYAFTGNLFLAEGNKPAKQFV